jgi:hypothetical protein
MRARVAVATVQGRAYFLIVNELKQRKILFISLIPGEPIPVEIRAVITTSKEKNRINHNKIVAYDPETDPQILGAEMIKILQGKELYENVVMGVDPGDAFGVAVLADGAIIDTENCFSVKETLNKIKNVLRTIDVSKSSVTIKVGSGVPIYRELLEALDQSLLPQVRLEIVGEAGTNRYSHEGTRSRELRHIISATRIAGRTGYVYSRRKIIE